MNLAQIRSCLMWIATASVMLAARGEAAEPPAPEQPPKVINVLYIEQPPRWEYRHLKLMLLRDRAVNVSCLLTAADRGFQQEADAPVPDFGPEDPRTGKDFVGRISRLPETREELATFDVIILGDVDSRMFTNAQSKLLADFVREGGGLIAIGGASHMPARYADTAIGAILPVAPIGAKAGENEKPADVDGFVPKVTVAASKWPCFAHLLRPADDEVPPVKHYGHCHDVQPKKGSTVLLEHPTAKAGDQPAPLLVMGEAGKGRALFSAIDDTWRWLKSDEDGYNAYWMELIKIAAGGK